MRKRKSKFAQVRHVFLMKVYQGDGSFKICRRLAKVIHAKQPVDLLLTAKHADKSIQLDGAGDTARCSGAICTYDHKDKFPHPVEGHVDFTPTRAFPVSKTDEAGLPTECYGYEHNIKNIVKLNDTRGGQKKLLQKLLKDGPIPISFRPIRYRSEKGRPGRNRKGTGVRDPMKRKGAHLRYAVYYLGGRPGENRK